MGWREKIGIPVDVYFWMITFFLDVNFIWMIKLFLFVEWIADVNERNAYFYFYKQGLTAGGCKACE